MYGGAAGGGKSRALLMAALQWITMPGYAALLLRRTFADLYKPDALIPQSHELLAGKKCEWDGQKHQWRFPNGATLSFGYLAAENDKYQYQGAAYSFYGYDELTQFTKTQYLYLFSRLRRRANANFPLRMRAASNPGGEGHEWVKGRFIDETANPFTRLFIPARLEDNPYLDRESYETSLAELDPITRRQLRHGDWQVRASAGVFKSEWFRTWKLSDDGEAYELPDGKRHLIEQCARFVVADIAGTEKRKPDDDPDFSVIGVCDVTPTNDLIVIDWQRGQWETPKVEDQLIESVRKWDAPYAVVEKNGIGLGVVQSARRRGVAIKAVVAKRGQDKLTRSQTAQIRMEAGTVYFPALARWREDLESELLGFPTVGMHDDQVDALAWACMHVQAIRGVVRSVEDDQTTAGRALRERADMHAERIEEGERQSAWVAWNEE